MTKSTQKKIVSIVTQYKQLFPMEYDMAVAGNKKRAESQTTGWGEAKDAEQLGREVFRWPDTLDAAFKTKLTDDEWTEFMEDKGTIWFQRTFPEFVPNTNIE